MKYDYSPEKICPSTITVDMDGDILKEVTFVGGCNGNLKALSSLVKGMHYKDIKEKLSGIHCGFKDTSCPDQLVKAIEEAMKNQKDS